MRIRHLVLALLLAFSTTAHAQWVPPNGPPALPPLNPITALGVYNSSAPTLTTGQMWPLGLDLNGYLKVDCITGCSGGGGTGNVNLIQVGGSSVTLGQKVTASSIPVALPSDQTIPVTGTVTASGNLSVVPTTSGGLSLSSTILPNNTTAIVVKGSAGQLYHVECFNNSAVIAYIKIYNATSATAGSGTPVWREMCPAPAAGGGGGFVSVDMQGLAFGTGITYIVTTGVADNDTTAPAANTYIVNVGFK